MSLSVTLTLIFTYSYLLNVEFSDREYRFMQNNDMLDTMYPSFNVSLSSAPLSPASFSSSVPPKGYLVYSEHCQIPDFDPFHPEIMQYFHRQKPFVTCSNVDPLTYLDFNDTSQRYVLWIVKDPVKSYFYSAELKCCYQVILRHETGIKADDDISLSKCVYFNNGTQLHPSISNILVRCRRKGRQVYINGYPMMPKRLEIRKRLRKWRLAKKNATSVLMIGIDSISRLSLKRAMPKTTKYLTDNNWFELSGYNKIADNTFPNLMAILTGQNQENSFLKCPPDVLHGLDDCSFIWKTFRDHGYITSYAEDWARLNTFNYLKVGFDHPPVDHYFRPFLLGAEQNLQNKIQSLFSHCLGFKHTAEYIYDYALELAKRYKQDPYFGLFWTSSMSHEDIAECSSMDEMMLRYLHKFSDIGAMHNAIVIFFSDHGIRYGLARKTLPGYLEERLPFIYISLPAHLQYAHPDFMQALRQNKHRLTNPFDLHMTLKHVLQLSGRVEDPNSVAPAVDCPRCQTLLLAVPHNRSCSDVGINDHFCTCLWYDRVQKNTKKVHQMTQTAIEYMNHFIATSHNGSMAKLCRPLRLAKIESAYRASQAMITNQTSNHTLELYRILFYTYPNQGIYEVTLSYNSSSAGTQLLGDVSRLNSYQIDGICVDDDKRFCSCHRI